MRKYLYYFIILLCMPLLVFAKDIETSQFSYGGAYNDVLNSVEATNDGGYIVVGSTKSRKIGEVSTNNGNGLIVKYDKNDNVEWQKFYGGNAHEEFYDIIVVDDGYIAVGYTLSTNIEGLNSIGQNDGLIVKLDKNGEIVWQTLIGGTGNDFIHAIQPLSNGNLIIVGKSDSTDFYDLNNNGAIDAFIGTITKDGKLISKRLYGGSQDDCFYDLAIKDDYIYVGGYVKSDMENHTNVGMHDSVLVKYDDDLEIEWEDFFSRTRSDMVRSVITTLDGGILVAGYTETMDDTLDNAHESINGYIAKYDIQGKQEWYKVYGGSKTDSFEHVVQAKNGDFIVVGKGFSSDIPNTVNSGDQDSYIVVFNKDGQLLLNKLIGGTELDFLTDVSIIDNKRFVGVGYTYSNELEGVYNKGGSDAMVVKGVFHYTITKLPTENGSFSAVEENENGKIEVSPDEGYRVSGLDVKDTLNRNVSIEIKDDKYYFELYDDVEVGVEFEKDLVENPETSDNVFLVFFLFIICILGVVVLKYVRANIGAKFE